MICKVNLFIAIDIFDIKDINWYLLISSAESIWKMLEISLTEKMRNEEVLVLASLLQWKLRS